MPTGVYERKHKPSPAEQSGYELRRLYDIGMAGDAIARLFGFERSSVYEVLRSLGPMRAPAQPRKLPTNQELIRLYQGGMNTTQIAKKYGCRTHKGVLAKLNRAGIEIRRSGPWNPICYVPDCGLPVHGIRHAGKGSVYGRLCYVHYKVWRNTLSREYMRKLNPEREHECLLTPEQWEWLTARWWKRKAVSLSRNPGRLLSPEMESLLASSSQQQ